jgi:hypothetical protein
VRTLNDTEILLLRLVAKQYFQVVPDKFKTYCVFNARVLAKVFEHFGLESEVVPCQALLSQPSKSSVIGFVGSSPGPGGWDGHAICRVGDYYIDATVHHFAGDLSEQILDTVIFKRLPIQSNVLGRSDIDEFNRFWWVTPPNVPDPTPPSDNPVSVLFHSKNLIRHVEKLLNPSSETSTRKVMMLLSQWVKKWLPANAV